MKGPGRYDDQCTRMLGELGAEVVLLIVLGGHEGSGFSMAALDTARARARTVLPEVLRDVADEIAVDLAPSGGEVS